MNRILGKVLVRETGAGVPDVVVVVFDVEGSGAAPPTQPPPARRLGSVVTEANGLFELQFEDADFITGGKQRRPDLMLQVIAPDDGATGSPPATQRILHSGTYPRIDAGRTEGYVLRVPAPALADAGLLYPRGPDAGERPSQEQILQTLDASVVRRLAVRGRLSEQVSSRLAIRRRDATRAAEVFRRFSLSRVPAAVREDPSFYVPGKDLRQAREVLVRRALGRVPQRPRPMKLQLGERDWTPLGARLDQAGQRRIRMNAFVDWLPPVLRRSPLALGPCDAPGAAARLVDAAVAAPAPPAGGGAAPAPAPAEPLTAESYVADFFRREQASRSAVDSPQRATFDEITRLVNELELRGGPADVPALHDFHDLQVAFEHIYAELEDKDVRDWGESLYRFVIQRYDFPEDLPDEVLGIDELDSLVSVVQRLNEEAPIFDPAPPDVAQMLPAAPAVWSSLDPVVQAQLTEMAEEWIQASAPRTVAVQWPLAAPQQAADDPWQRRADELRAGAQALLDAAVAALPQPFEADSPGLMSAKKILADLIKRLAEPYKFDVYVADTCNYGVLVTYRQEWVPQSYQVGELVSTIPLAPKESRRFSKRTVVKRSRSQKELDEAQWVRKQDSSQTHRADAEIVDRAVNNSNFKANAEGSGKVGAFNLSASTGIEQSGERSSAETKRSFREQVLRAAEEYRGERRVEVEFSATEESDTTAAGEIGNPNDELAVTYLFYELQRRYEISERIHELMPVVLVANEVPAPHHIGESWLLRHAWVLRRVLLDDAFLTTLDALAGVPAAQFTLEILRSHLEAQKRIVERLREQVYLKTKQMGSSLEDLMVALQKQEGARRREASEGVFEAVGEALFGGGARDDPDAGRMRAERARAALDLVAAERQELLAKLGSETGALEAAAERYTAALREHLTRKAEISRLCLHVKDNICYYMQSIWNHEPPDQRVLRLSRIRTFWLTAPEDAEIRVDEDGGVHVEVPDDVRLELDRPLAEIADLDRLLGYFGNYMVFPLARNNLITAFMMSEYVDRAMGLRDPDEFGAYTTDELIDHIRCLARHQPGMSEDERARWKRIVQDRLMNPWRDKDVVVVPTGSLYIEALPAQRSILEDFKLAHRAIDTARALEEKRGVELENLRRAARLLAGEREDPDVDRRIIVSGNAENVIVPPDA